MSGRGQIGNRVGGKGSWRRKGKKQPHGDNLEAQKVWAACQRTISSRIFPLDNATVMISDSDKALSFNKPELLCDQRANTYVLHGKPVEKPMSEVLQDLIAGMDLSKFAGKDKEAGDDLGDVPENLDFSKPEEEKKDETPATA